MAGTFCVAGVLPLFRNLRALEFGHLKSHFGVIYSPKAEQAAVQPVSTLVFVHNLPAEGRHASRDQLMAWKAWLNCTTRTHPCGFRRQETSIILQPVNRQVRVKA
jgi:hypothetical protein